MTHDPVPAASFNEPPTFLSGAYWRMRGDWQAPARHRPGPDLFARLRARRRVVARLAVTAVAAVVGAVLLAVVPAIGLAVLLVAVWSAVIDLMLLARLRRSIAEAWVDLARPPE